LKDSYDQLAAQLTEQSSKVLEIETENIELRKKIDSLEGQLTSIKQSREEEIRRALA
jgi:23S rRNA U2552 (ribose-2'-O)-methylase RlmE/FtsJ